jgi:hypothetical protein
VKQVDAAPQTYLSKRTKLDPDIGKPSELLLEKAKQADNMPVLDALRCIQIKRVDKEVGHNCKVNSMSEINVQQPKV